MTGSGQQKRIQTTSEMGSAIDLAAPKGPLSLSRLYGVLLLPFTLRSAAG